MLNTEQLAKLRSEIVLNSLYYSDYENSLNIDSHKVCDFFDGFLDFIQDIYPEDYETMDYSDFLKKYDTVENIQAWYDCFDCDPLARKKWEFTASTDGDKIDYETIIESDIEPDFWTCYDLAAEHGCTFFSVTEE